MSERTERMAQSLGIRECEEMGRGRAGRLCRCYHRANPGGSGKNRARMWKVIVRGAEGEDLSPKYGGRGVVASRQASRTVQRPHTSPPYLGERSPNRTK